MMDLRNSFSLANEKTCYIMIALESSINEPIKHWAISEVIVHEESNS